MTKDELLRTIDQDIKDLLAARSYLVDTVIVERLRAKIGRLEQLRFIVKGRPYDQGLEDAEKELRIIVEQVRELTPSQPFGLTGRPVTHRTPTPVRVGKWDDEKKTYAAPKLTHLTREEVMEKIQAEMKKTFVGRDNSPEVRAKIEAEMREFVEGLDRAAKVSKGRAVPVEVKVNVEFRDHDPDRIAEVMRRDLMKTLAERTKPNLDDLVLSAETVKQVEYELDEICRGVPGYTMTREHVYIASGPKLSVLADRLGLRRCEIPWEDDISLRIRILTAVERRCTFPVTKAP